eukprot:CAMPEP_0197389284 /NCGR_PEP_ID=MMETSP1165-20131217/1595_1 /TAXON_ID=284809 /ORGANISM="Chrysocystis fragilis, Strain CCMP3189" /LENGTH=206 /DNA_ID=CAMNT_0042914687 /DNA_START=46 /DNA_END=666 /DNA_ORIENTATION=-
MAPRAWALVPAALALVAAEVDHLLLDVPASSKRCVGEQFPDDSLGKWSFELRSDGAGAPKGVRVTVKDPKKKLLYSTTLAAGDISEFPFTTKVPGLHKACLENRQTKPQRVALSVSQGFAVKEYGKLVDEHFGPISKQLDDAMAMLAEIATEMDMSLTREEHERDAAAESEGRIATMGYISMAVLIGLACWQIIYLRSFFRSKKLL